MSVLHPTEWDRAEALACALGNFSDTDCDAEDAMNFIQEHTDEQHTDEQHADDFDARFTRAQFDPCTEVDVFIRANGRSRFVT